MSVPRQEPLTASVLAAAPLHEQKQMIGEWLAPLLWSWKQVLRAGLPGGKHPKQRSDLKIPSLVLNRLPDGLAQSAFTG